MLADSLEGRALLSVEVDDARGARHWLCRHGEEQPVLLVNSQHCRPQGRQQGGSGCAAQHAQHTWPAQRPAGRRQAAAPSTHSATLTGQKWDMWVGRCTCGVVVRDLPNRCRLLSHAAELGRRGRGGTCAARGRRARCGRPVATRSAWCRLAGGGRAGAGGGCSCWWVAWGADSAATGVVIEGSGVGSRGRLAAAATAGGLLRACRRRSPATAAPARQAQRACRGAPCNNAAGRSAATMRCGGNRYHFCGVGAWGGQSSSYLG